jgi:Protein of unknown function (DUF3054)
VTVDARPRTPPRVLALGDAAAIVLFVIVGLTNHDEGITLSGISRTALPILGAWFAVSIFAGTYARPGPRTLLVTWVIAVPVGVAIRAIALHRPADDSQITFGFVAMIATLVFVLGWRGLAALAARRR